jgi:branched-chain amino acid transport system permease protein
LAISDLPGPGALTDGVGPARRWIGWALATLLLALVPVLVQNPYHLSVATSVLITVMLTLSLHLVVGFSGQFSLAHAAFFGIGAYVPAILTSRFGLSPWLGLPAGVGLGIAVALVIGLPTVRLRGYYLATATLAFAFLIEVFARQAVDVTGGAYGIQRLPPLDLFGQSLRGAAYYEAALVALLASTFLLDNLMRSPLGRSIIATRDNASAAASIGVNVVQVRLTAFVMSAAVAALAGWVQAFFQLGLNPSLLSVDLTFVWLAMVIVGGLGHVTGVMTATVLLVIAPEVLGFATEHQALGFGVLMVGATLFAPHGLGGLIDGVLGKKRLHLQRTRCP